MNNCVILFSEGLLYSGRGMLKVHSTDDAIEGSSMHQEGHSDIQGCVVVAGIYPHIEAKLVQCPNEKTDIFSDRPGKYLSQGERQCFCGGSMQL